uniref:Uncharacterized protein n=1 Tax=viral metagenome TaxID=1070528 RepID=A0A6C0HSS5_9ZZZZ
MLSIEIKDFCSENIHYKNSTKNSIIPNGSFTYINYTNSDVTLNTIYLLLKDNSEENLFTLQNIESDLLKVSSKIKQYKICQSYQGICKKNKSFLLKITGIWESSNFCGVSFKIIHMPCSL